MLRRDGQRRDAGRVPQAVGRVVGIDAADVGAGREFVGRGGIDPEGDGLSLIHI